ncbi:hypothetical protein G3I24_15405, partial [Micromonospora aurantiaca]|nr:hypothetical protein [Micromonospora aurantiaca]
ALADDLGLDAAARASLDAYVGELRDWMAGILKWHRESDRYDERRPSLPKPRGLGTSAFYLFSRGGPQSPVAP